MHPKSDVLTLERQDQLCLTLGPEELDAYLARQYEDMQFMLELQAWNLHRCGEWPDWA